VFEVEDCEKKEKRLENGVGSKKVPKNEDQNEVEAGQGAESWQTPPENGGGSGEN
jgi:hypothetical protein